VLVLIDITVGRGVKTDLQISVKGLSVNLARRGGVRRFNVKPLGRDGLEFNHLVQPVVVERSC